MNLLLRSARFRRLLATAALVATANARAAGSTDTFEVSMRTIVMVFGMSLLGGFVSWITKIRKGLITGWSLMQLVGELCTSAFSGLLCYLLCYQAGISLPLTIAFVGIAGHKGAQAIALFEKYAERRWGELGATRPPKDSP